MSISSCFSVERVGDIEMNVAQGEHTQVQESQHLSPSNREVSQTPLPMHAGNSRSDDSNKSCGVSRVRSVLDNIDMSEDEGDDSGGDVISQRENGNKDSISPKRNDESTLEEGGGATDGDDETLSLPWEHK